ncbi:hypothetical protein HPB51_022586 [Rhipicephalus microplus]|uniref:Endonuclease/exonuclease/phosphatase domain-containing protein n=1 Tax=Rhipicephalus microplus TaxID=6941 RepID=A0A9J6DWI6_RHIMP|nr:hypothetical protein HPB51_022586 [Rhipicephalus microplus]
MARNRRSTRDTPQFLHVWQWNCRRYRRKRRALTQILATERITSDVIALQELQCTPTLPGYTTYTDVTNNTPHRTATLVFKHVTVIEDILQSTSISHVLLELVLCSRSSSSLYVLNVYSAPNARNDHFSHLFALLCKLGKHIVIVGDFNTPHPAWGYATETPKDRRLAQVLAIHRMTLLTEPHQPTRLARHPPPPMRESPLSALAFFESPTPPDSTPLQVATTWTFAGISDSWLPPVPLSLFHKDSCPATN